MKMSIVSVSRDGYGLSKKIKQKYPQAQLFTTGEWREPADNPVAPDLKTLTGRLFNNDDTLIFIMASGIAVRMIAPYVNDKTSDPAVLVADDGGRWVIALLSGHLGGANRMAEEVAQYIQALPVITTASDSRGLVAVDMLSVENQWTISDMVKARRATAALLEGKSIGVTSWKPMKTQLPKGYFWEDAHGGNAADWHLVISPYVTASKENELWLIPRCITLGMGSRKMADVLAAEKLVMRSLRELNIDARAVGGIASIDLKADEPALLRMAKKLNVELTTYSAQELAALDQQFSGSHFVKSVTGVGSVAETAGCKKSGGRCLMGKKASEGVTLSIWEDC